MSQVIHINTEKQITIEKKLSTKKVSPVIVPERVYKILASEKIIEQGDTEIWRIELLTGIFQEYPNAYREMFYNNDRLIQTKTYSNNSEIVQIAQSDYLYNIDASLSQVIKTDLRIGIRTITKTFVYNLGALEKLELS